MLFDEISKRSDFFSYIPLVGQSFDKYIDVRQKDFLNCHIIDASNVCNYFLELKLKRNKNSYLSFSFFFPVKHNSNLIQLIQ
jgi:hypothetical protein